MSKKALLFAGIGVVLIGLLLFWYLSRDWEIKNYPSTENGPVLMFGDSLVEGVGATAGNALPEQLGKLVGVPILNYGISGDTTRNGLTRLTPALEEDPKVAIVVLGGNDFLKKVPREETFQNLEKIVTAFQSQGAITIVVGVRSGIVGGGADEQYEDLAKRTGSVYVSDTLAGVFAHTDLMSDALHPNDRGYRQIAERLASELRDFLK